MSESVERVLELPVWAAAAHERHEQMARERKEAAEAARLARAEAVREGFVRTLNALLRGWEWRFALEFSPSGERESWDLEREAPVLIEPVSGWHFWVRYYEPHLRIGWKRNDAYYADICAADRPEDNWATMGHLLYRIWDDYREYNERTWGQRLVCGR